MPTLCPRAHARVKSLRRRRVPTALLAALFALAAAAGCGGGGDESTSPKEIYDVPPTVEVPVADDPQEVRRPPGLSGRLPAGFPEDLPLFLPASLIDYGLDERWVDIMCPADLGRVRAEMLDKARGAGWQVNGETLRLGEREVRLEFRDGNPGSVVRVHY
ncbi:MAG: hypothetical protein AAGM22_02340 [Acidobacteriota bacterium]